MLEFVNVGRSVVIGPGMLAFVGRSWPCNGASPAKMITSSTMPMRLTIVLLSSCAIVTANEETQRGSLDFAVAHE